MRRTTAGFLALALAFAGCATRGQPEPTPDPERTGTAEMEQLQAPYSAPAGGYTRQAGPLELPPEPLSQELPVYPASALPAEVSCVARILYHTETDGTSSLVRLDWETAPPEVHREAFATAIREAVASWVFKPAVRVVPTTLPDGAVEPSREPVRHAGRAVIRFRVESGVPIVE